MNNTITGVEQEIAFWKEFVKTQRFIDGWAAKIKTPELNQEVADFIKDHIPMHGNILDCGSGVVSILNGLMPGNYRLVATDLLGEEYTGVFDYCKYGLTHPLPIAAENLEFDNFFDIVHMSNALDHCQDPRKAFEQLYAAVKPGGYVILQGFENEANHEKWFGMHQWNIHLNSNVLCIDGKDGHYFGINNPVFAKTIHLPNNKSWFIFIVKKSSDNA